MLAIAGVVFTGVVVWITTPSPGGAGPSAGLDTTAAAALEPVDGLSPVPPGPTIAGAGGATVAVSGAGSPTSPPTSALSSVVADCTPASLGQRAARTLIVGLPDVKEPTDPMIRKVLDIGVGGIFLNPGNVESRSQVMRLIRGIRAAAGRPIVISVDEEPGRVSTFGDLIGASPSARRMANEGPATEVRAYAQTVAVELARLGIDLNLAPVADLTDGPYDEIIGDRSFSADAAIASEYAVAYAEGMTDGGVRAVAKHFPGQGRSTDDIHFEAADPITVPLDTLRITDVRPFRDLVRAGIPVVMMNHVRYTALDRGLPASLSPKAYTLLRELGFRGVAITDSLGMGAVNLTWGFYDSAPMAVAAGADGLLATDGFFAEEMRDGLVDAIAAGRLSERRLNEAAARMVALAGADPRPVACVDVDVPRMEPAPMPLPAPVISDRDPGEVAGIVGGVLAGAVARARLADDGR